MSELNELIKYIEILEAEPFTGWTGDNKIGYLTACISIKKKAEKLASNLANGVITGEKQCNLPVAMPRFSEKEIDELAFKWSSERSNGDAEQDTECMYDFAQGLAAMQKLLLP